MTEFLKWIAERKALSIRQIEVEAKVPLGTLHKYVRGVRGYPQKFHEQTLVVLRKYGYGGYEI